MDKARDTWKVRANKNEAFNMHPQQLKTGEAGRRETRSAETDQVVWPKVLQSLQPVERLPSKRGFLVNKLPAPPPLWISPCLRASLRRVIHDLFLTQRVLLTLTLFRPSLIHSP